MFTVRAPAKINLDLQVGPLRRDGFHPISSWFVTVGLFDELAFEPSDRDAFECSDPSLPTDESNLVVRALRLVPHAPVRVRLTKRIPAGGGLGGGSSDAAATLLALTSGDEYSLTALAAQLGSDVPFFLSHPSALCTGRGEHVITVRKPKPRAALLFLPETRVSTPTVFRKFDTLPPPISELYPRNLAVQIYDEFAMSPAMKLLETLGNDLEPATFSLHPELGELRANLQHLLSRPVRMTGSGSTLFTLYDTLAEAEQAATTVKACRALPVELCPNV